QWVSVTDLITEVLDRCYTATRNHQVTTEVDEKLLPVQVDFRLISEVLANLVENAAKYSPTGSRIDIRAKMEDNQLMVSVQDQGEGILPDEIERIFEKFYRGSRSKDSDGTGMGLAIARGIIDAHGGRIWAENGPQQGAIFRFVIPLESRDIA